mgnify:FL=1
MTKYGEDRNGQNKICVITGLPGSGKSHLLKEKIIPELRKQSKKIICVDPNCEYKPSRGFMVYRIQDYDNAEEEFETMIRYYMTDSEGKKKKPDCIIVDESNVVFNKLSLPPYTKKLVNTLRHEKIDLVVVARRPVDVNITMSELARERYVFRVSGVNDIKRLNDIMQGLGDEALQLGVHDYFHIVDDHEKTVITA